MIEKDKNQKKASAIIMSDRFDFKANLMNMDISKWFFKDSGHQKDEVILYFYELNHPASKYEKQKLTETQRGMKFITIWYNFNYCFSLTDWISERLSRQKLVLFEQYV